MADRVTETSLTQGTGAFTLLGAMNTYQSFASGLSGVFGYAIICAATNQWEVGLGSISSETLTRLLPISGSSGAGTFVSFGAGVKQVFNTFPEAFADGARRFKAPCVVSTTGNVTIATALATGAVLNGIELTAGMRVFVPFQTTLSQIGIYIVAASPVRAPDLWTGMGAAGAVVVVSTGGTALGGTLWQCTSPKGSDVVDTNSLTFSKVFDPAVGTVVGTSPTVVDAIAIWGNTLGTSLLNSTFLLHPVTTEASVSQHKAQWLAWFDTLFTATFASTTLFDQDAACLFKLTLTGNTTIELDRHSIGQRTILLLIQDGTGGRSVTWPSSPVVINWNNGLPPILDPTPGGRDLIVLRCVGEDGYGNAIYEEEWRKTSAPRLGITAATDAATVNFNLDVSPNQKVTLGGNRTLALLGTQNVGQFFKIKLIQDGTGSRTVTWWSGITWAGSVPTLSTSGGEYDTFMFEVTGSGTYDGYILGQGL